MSFPRSEDLSARAKARLTCHQVAVGHTSTAGNLPDFDVFCMAVGIVADQLTREVDREQEREAERQAALAEIAHVRDLERRAERAFDASGAGWSRRAPR